MARESRKFMVCIIAFFAIGAIIALPMTISLLDRGKTLFIAIGLGASVGGYGAWFLFRVGHFLVGSRRKIPPSDRDA